MKRRSTALIAAAGAALAGSLVLPSGPAIGGDIPPNGPGTAGPPYVYDTALMGQYALLPLADQAMITRTQHGYLVRAGQQDSHLVITLTDAGLRFADTGTQQFRRLARSCHRETVEVGVAAVCRVPGWVTADQPLLLEVWPRLGDDYLDASTLSDSFAMTMLADAGNDEAHFGAGPDFFNGFTGRDRVWGGGGNDWIRSGDGNDAVRGGDGNDQLVATDGADTLYGDAGADLVGGGDGNDALDGGAGSDLVKCDSGQDAATTDGADRLRYCEQVTR